MNGEWGMENILEGLQGWIHVLMTREMFKGNSKGNSEIWKPEILEIWKSGNLEIWKTEIWKTGFLNFRNI